MEFHEEGAIEFFPSVVMDSEGKAELWYIIIKQLSRRSYGLVIFSRIRLSEATKVICHHEDIFVPLTLIEMKEVNAH